MLIFIERRKSPKFYEIMNLKAQSNLRLIINVDKTSSSSIFNVITLGLALGFKNPGLSIGAFGFVGDPGFKRRTLKFVPFIRG